jgi:2-desacetyl-2-hydroxyethyl bacteriochlorophyllide A dehydrogenase
MKAVVWSGPNEMNLEDVAEPQAAPGWVVVKPSATGICGSDITAYKGMMGVSAPGTIRGHEFSGKVVAADNDEASWIGQTVVVNPLVSCGHCRHCRSGADNQCPTQKSLGILLPGSLAEYVAAPVGNLIAMSGVPPTAAAVTEPLAQALHDVVLAQRDSPVRSALVIGAGSIGYLAVQVARHRGIESIVVLDPATERRIDALRSGASMAFAAPEDVDAYLVEQVEKGFDAVLDLVGFPATRADALRWTRRGGTAVFVGLHSAGDDADWRAAIRRELTVRCANASSTADFEQAAQWLRDGRIVPFAASDVHPLSAAPTVFRDLAHGAITRAKTFIAGIGN